jgi:hypothetical protein
VPEIQPNIIVSPTFAETIAGVKVNPSARINIEADEQNLASAKNKSKSVTFFFIVTFFRVRELILVKLAK